MSWMRGLLGTSLLALGMTGVKAGSCDSGRERPAPPSDAWTERLVEAGVRDRRVIEAMAKVRRVEFLPAEQRRFELEDRPLSIGHGQTTSQPTLIARMIEELRLEPGCRVLEVGSGSGYQTALLAELCDEVYAIDIVAPLVERSRATLERLGVRGVHLRAGDGYLGWPEGAPFDGIVVCAAAPEVPRPLVEQLAPRGRLVIPVGAGAYSGLELVTKRSSGEVDRSRLLDVVFVPLTGPHAERDRLDGGARAREHR